MTSKKRPRFLPAYVTSFKDRHGKVRLRYRRKGHEDHYFKATLGTEAFRVEYAAREAAVVDAAPPGPKVSPGSIDDLVTRYFAVPSRLGPTKTTQTKVRNIIERFRERYAESYVVDFTFEHIDAIVSHKAKKVQVGARMEGGIEAARKLRKELVRLFDYGEKIRMIPAGSNPVRHAERIRVAPGERSAGYHTWTEEEIQQYRTRHAIGSKARLALELLLWTGQRRGDAYLLGPADLIGGRTEVRQSKTGKRLGISTSPQLLAAIEAMPPRPGAQTFLVTEWGKPFSNAGFGNKMRQWCDEAGLPQCTAHGIRKAIMRRMAELDMGNQTLKSVSGHSRDDEVAIYTRAANQRKMADAAIAILSRWELGAETQMSNPENAGTSNPAESA